ncbi:MAG: MBOAT family protein [Clostridia bacterium]|nr:MBOAT family protein [Clostridia bacterium]
MLFSSLEFLYVFLPLTLIFYALSPRGLKNGILLLVSLLFYAYGEPIYVFLMIATIALNYGFGRWLQRTSARKGVLVCAVAVNVGLLFFFKYAGAIFPALGQIPLPIGISFYTFQALSYVVDVYREEVRASDRPVAFGAYITMFPQLIAGPIVRYSDVERQLMERGYTAERIASGIAAFSVGLAKKVLLANPAGALADSLLAEADTVLCAVLWLVFYSFQIYFDFSGYSDMAVGLGRMLGFDFPENFCYPYTAKSITDFWRRWHITLSSFFREYVYIPLGGNRRGRGRTYLNLLIVWSLTGLWHGASFNFLLWGLYFFIILLVEKAGFYKLLNQIPSVFSHGYAILLILVGWFIFASDGTKDTLSLLSLFGNAPFSNGWSLYELRRHLPFLSVLIFGVTPIPKRIFSGIEKRCPRSFGMLRIVFCMGSLILCTAYLVSSGYNPFLYFRF